jgi:hypothetical protein
MRISVYCADQTAYHDEAVLQQFYQVYPYLQGYHINDVHKELCDCWSVPPVKSQTKTALLFRKPALLGDGALDPACRPLYIDMIHHYMANSQRLLFTNRSHGVLGGLAGDAIIKMFLDNPFKKLNLPKKILYQY